MEKPLHLVYDLALPSIVKNQIVENTRRFLMRMYRYGDARLFVHLKNEGSQVLCNLTMLTRNGRYHAKAAGWDAMRTVSDAIDNAETQVQKHMELQAHIM